MSISRGDRQISWMVSERTGRWATALRVAVARDAACRGSDHNTHRIKEFRGLMELSELLPNIHPAIALVEMGEKNLTDVLEFFSNRYNQSLRFVALMDESWEKSTGKPKSNACDQHLICNVLHEAGAVDVLKTPRQIARLLPLAARLARAGSCFGKAAGDDSIAEMAKLALPWQDD